MDFDRLVSLSCANLAALLNNGHANVNQRFRIPPKHAQTIGHDATLLHIAAWKGDADSIKLLLGRGSDSNSLTSLLEKTALHLVPFDASDECLFLLLEAGAEVKKDAKGMTFLETVAEEQKSKDLKQSQGSASASQGTDDTFGKAAIRLRLLIEAGNPFERPLVVDRFSVGTALILIMLAKAVYIDINDVQRGMVPTMMRRWGFKNLVPLKNGDNVGFVVERNGDVFISFRGTKTLDNVFTDLNAQEERGFHRGFFLAVDSIWGDLTAALGTIWAQLLTNQKNQTMAAAWTPSTPTPGGQKTSKKFFFGGSKSKVVAASPSSLPQGGVGTAIKKRIFLTGHSLGGAMASIAMHRLHKEFGIDADDLILITFAQPRAFKKGLAIEFDSLFSRAFIVNRDGDPVPTVPPITARFSHVGSVRHIDKEGNLHGDPYYILHDIGVEFHRSFAPSSSASGSSLTSSSSSSIPIGPSPSSSSSLLKNALSSGGIQHNESAKLHLFRQLWIKGNQMLKEEENKFALDEDKIFGSSIGISNILTAANHSSDKYLSDMIDLYHRVHPLSQADRDKTVCTTAQTKVRVPKDCWKTSSKKERKINEERAAQTQMVVSYTEKIPVPHLCIQIKHKNEDTIRWLESDISILTKLQEKEEELISRLDRKSVV